jgi:phage terminase small subunit
VRYSPRVGAVRYSSQAHFAEEVPVSQTFNFLERHAGTDDCSRVEQSPAQYRKFADECRRLAKFVQTADERKVLQEMEAAWTKVAEEVEGEAGKNGI